MVKTLNEALAYVNRPVMYADAELFVTAARVEAGRVVFDVMYDGRQALESVQAADVDWRATDALHDRLYG